MTTKPTDKVRAAFAILNRNPNITIRDAAARAGCSRSAIYRSSLYPAYAAKVTARASIPQK